MTTVEGSRKKKKFMTKNIVKSKRSLRVGMQLFSRFIIYYFVDENFKGMWTTISTH